MSRTPATTAARRGDDRLMDWSRVRALAATQEGVVTTAQCVALGFAGSTVDRRVQSGDWQRLHRGVLLTHAGPVPWRSRAQAALLWAGRDAVLSHAAAGYLHGFVATAPAVLDVSIPPDRRVMPAAGLRIHPRRVRPAGLGRPRRTAREETVVDLLGSARSTDGAIGLLTDAVRAGADVVRIAEILEARPTARRRGLARELVGAVEHGVESPLELRYHRRVERRHGLPAAALQVRAVIDGHLTRADALYEGHGVRIELDGAVGHTGARQADDLWRDNAVLIERSEITLRYRWRHVAVFPCETAAQVAAALAARGWPGTPRPCGPRCTVARTSPARR